MVEATATPPAGQERVPTPPASEHGEPTKLISERAPLKDAISHKLAWKGHRDLHQLQGRPIQLRFHLKNAKLYSITPGTRHTHYVPSYE